MNPSRLFILWPVATSLPIAAILLASASIAPTAAPSSIAWRGA